jgi:signal recognition particle receptor subunit beta
VIQYNKRDLPNAVELEKLREVLNPGGTVLDFEASAATGKGVFETLKALAKLVLNDLKKGAR